MRLARISMLWALCAPALTQSPPSNGPAPVHADWHALIGATAVTEVGSTIENATIIIKAGAIVSVEPAGQAPRGARTWDYRGHTIYPAFVDAHVRVPVEATKDAVRHWNQNVLADRSALEGGIDEKRASQLRELGFGAAAIAPDDGIFRGLAAAVSLAEPRDGRRRTVLRRDVFGVLGFRPIPGSRDSYPRSQMGVIALMRQTLLDARWNLHDDATTRPYLDALAPRRHALVFDTNDELEALRAAKILQEFDQPGAILGSGLEFRRLDAIQATGMTVILPLAFPAPPKIESIDDRERVTLRELLTWEHAPTNPRRLLDRGVVVALTSDKVKPKRFWRQLRRAFDFGLTHDLALRALTTTPARLLGLGSSIGKIAPGFRANLLVLDGRLDEEKSERRAIWIDGRHHEIEAEPELELTGRWTAALELGGAQVDAIEFKSNKKATVFAGESNVSAQRVRLRSRQLDMTFDATELGGNGVITLSGVVDPKRMFGAGVDANGRHFGWSARHAGPLADKKRDDKAPKPKRDVNLEIDLPVPFGAYGTTELPSRERLVVRGATIWTSGSGGTIEDGVLVTDDEGRIEFVGPASALPALVEGTVVDASGLHVTPGLIDCHSHTGISRGVNEGTQAVTAEVRIGDVVNPDDINWYRELAGGLTAVNQLHGSANPIGGQNSVVKIRWGVADAEGMKLVGAPGGIKFALGENVKQSNWGSGQNSRYPQTRMGVEALMLDRFTAARDYAARLARDPNTRRDLELDALAEILSGERLIHCHSYRQDEILMLCRIAKRFGFKIGTFQHGLECYKVAEAVAEASHGASVFTDWWAYKFEVVDAIPENGAILWETGVPVSFNSDSNELARRMNGEAAKAVKYGGVPPDEALKFVTLAPARQLGVADRIGSLEVGKDADFVIWSGNPLSSMVRCLATYIDGRRYWSVATDRAARESAKLERERLIQLVMGLDESEFEDVTEGRDPTIFDEIDNQPGDCGCCEERSR